MHRPSRGRRAGSIVLFCGATVLAACASGAGPRADSGHGFVGHPFARPRPQPAPLPRFEDVTAQAGLRLPKLVPHVPPRCMLSATVLDREFPDAHLANSDSVNSALCQMESFTGGVAVGDYDGDGRPDIYVTRLDGPGRLFRNQGNGTFEDVTSRAGLATLDEPSVGAAFVDVDNDGDEDLAVSTLGGHQYFLYVNDGHGHFSEQAQQRGVAFDDGKIHFGYSIAVGDYDRDGYPDLYLTEYRGLLGLTVDSPVASSRLLHNLGAKHPGYFEDVSDHAGVGVAQGTDHMFAFGATFRDLDGDGWPDLAVTADFGTSKLFWNQGNGTFSDGTKAAGVGTEQNGMGSTTGDFDGDGLPDRFVSAVFDTRGSKVTTSGNWGGSGNRLYRNLGNRRFEDVTSTMGVRNGDWGWGSAFVDTTNSGVADLVQVSGMDVPVGALAAPFVAGPTHYWRLMPNGHYADIAARVGLTATNGRGLAVFDYDGDGRLDLLIARPGTSPVLYRNVTPDPGAWLRVIVRGTRSNRDGLNTVVTVRPGGGRPQQTIEIQSVTDFLGQSERVAHFGLGRGITHVGEVTVRFPVTGHTQVLRDVAVDKTIVVTERT